MQSQVSKNMMELCGNDIPWKLLRVEANDFPEGTILFEVIIGEVYKSSLIAMAPLTRNGLHVVKSYPDGALTSMGLTMEGALHNAISRGLSVAIEEAIR